MVVRPFRRLCRPTQWSSVTQPSRVAKVHFGGALSEYEGTSHLRQRRRSAKIGGVQVINLKPLKGEVRGADYTR